MTNFTTEGFLSSEIVKFEELIHSNYSEKFDLIKDVNKLSHGNYSDPLTSGKEGIAVPDRWQRMTAAR